MPELTEIKGVGPVLAKACADNGYGNVEQIATAMLHDLIAIPGINEAKARLVISAAQDLLQKEPVSNGEAMPLEAAAEPVVAPSENAKAKKRKAEKKKKKGKKNKKKGKEKPKKKKKKKTKKNKKS